MENYNNTVTTPLPDPLVIDDVSAVIQPIFGSIAFVGNTFTLIVALATKQIRKKRSSFLIMDLAVKDAMIGALYVFYGICLSHDVVLGNLEFVYIIECVLVSTSALVIILIAMERYFAIIAPFKHLRYVTKRALFIAIFLDWFISTSVVITLKFTFNLDVFIKVNLISVCMLLSVSVTTAFIYLVILLAVRRDSLQLKQSRNVSERYIRKQNVNIIFTFSLVAGILFLCYMPYALAYIIVHTKALSTTDSKPLGMVQFKDVLVFRLFIPLNSAVNVFIYWLRIPELRMAYKNVLWLWRIKSTKNSYTSVKIGLPNRN
ncbi:D(1A) dopamine receptor-like isoform X1 [Anneissia japonica]|uniref:D(1A) dopamine receptor-like isoform X1 n=1 Tax=Anneissia japonica TaxID=1529436 RepID=UPI0014258D5E|nr:D(1A) dopamine receptor-like isoform X1 [Anneissia japonica]XP_033125602.1 D(1A) dopamine receptor-like isoform X1 [Anneissia japonica]XP_033125603.1 D(1A) dopamine receptor-like isoform X1 [Anneissia japonica]XP_033125604.1 D(1A) dopamine receptor-like isoform X1 [Anneissia japonica]XP_033125605.1 D(1A) dopamine receptor-like isoform X2 [Anneissia japonica]XP_033125606.1 D(1A) dopamine receptor-like isoform X1 [Anneissia japonica]